MYESKGILKTYGGITPIPSSRQIFGKAKPALNSFMASMPGHQYFLSTLYRAPLATNILPLIILNQGDDYHLSSS